MKATRGARSGAVCRGLVCVFALMVAGCLPGRRGSGPARFEIVDATITDIHRAMLAGRLTARRLVDAYASRMQAYNRSGPQLNALLAVNPIALEAADSLDAELRRTGELAGPLHGIPVIIDDMYSTVELPATAGSAALAGVLESADAHHVRRLREAGAIILAKANVAELGLSPYETVGSALPGHTRNPYAPARVPGGGSGGTAAAVAASFATVGLGSDAFGSLRGAAAHTSLVAIRATMGLSSRSGIVPVSRDADMGGPIARTVADAVIVFDVIVGADPADSITALAGGRRDERYRDYLVTDALDGARIGVVHRFSDTETADAEVVARFNEAVAVLRRAGATTVEPVDVPALDSIGPIECPSFLQDLVEHLGGAAASDAIGRLRGAVAEGRVHPSVRPLLTARLAVEAEQRQTRCEEAERRAERLREAVREALWRNRLDALVYPTWSNPPRMIGDLNSPAGRNAQRIADATGFPAITVPMGYVGTERLPVGLEFLGDAWSDWKLIALAYSYEQATRHRRPPPWTPRLEPGGG